MGTGATSCENLCVHFPSQPGRKGSMKKKMPEEKELVWASLR